MKIERLAAVGLVSLALAGAAGAAFGEGRPPSPRTFDYWQPEWMVRELWGPGNMPKSMMARLLRHTTYMQFGVPDAYAGAKPTVPHSAETVAAGRKVYEQNCASCHGKDGLGDGDAAKAVSPSPALLAYMIRRPVSVDEYLLWTISDGGKQFETDMPAFKDKLSRDDIFRVVSYMRAGFPQADAAPQEKPQEKK